MAVSGFLCGHSSRQCGGDDDDDDDGDDDDDDIDDVFDNEWCGGGEHVIIIHSWMTVMFACSCGQH